MKPNEGLKQSKDGDANPGKVLGNCRINDL